MEEWHDQIPNAPDLGEGAAVSERKPPYSIIVCAPWPSYDFMTFLLMQLKGFDANGGSGTYLLVVMKLMLCLLAPLECEGFFFLAYLSIQGSASLNMEFCPERGSHKNWKICLT